MATVISEKLTINGGDVVLDGLDFTGNGYVEVYGADSVTVKNCRVYGMNLPSAKNYWLHIYGDIPVKLVIERNFFGSNPTSGSNKMYNLIEPTAKLMNGSSVSDNYFVDDCCYHNFMNVYGCENNAVISINNNVVEMTAGGLRIGVKGEPVCTINVRNNKVLAINPIYSDTDQGLITVQGYGFQTTTFKNMTIIASGNELASEQVGYGWYDSGSLELNSDNMPKIILNGKIAEFPIYH